MSAGNAFAKAGNGTGLQGGHQDEFVNGARPTKRQRLSDAGRPAIWAPCAQAETSLEVDIMILDHVAFQATKTCLDSRKSQQTGSNISSSSLGRHLQLADSFTSIFKARHPNYRPDAELRLRLLLLKMTTLFTQRYTLNPTTPDRESLKALRDSSLKRARNWLDTSDFAHECNYSPDAFQYMNPIASEALERNRAHVLHQLGIPAEDEAYEDAFYGTSSCVSLRDLVPLFIEVSAASSGIHGSALTERWMRLACEFMLQACLEQYLICGAQGEDALDEPFAWGYCGRERIAGDTVGGDESREAQINEMFEDDNYATEVEGWTALKAEYIKELIPDHLPQQIGIDEWDTDVGPHLESVASKHPIDEFEASTLKFLEALMMSIPEPVLLQLEKGQLDGMSKGETEDFLKQCGVAPSAL